VVKLISDIGSQTICWPLNATIEAASRLAMPEKQGFRRGRRARQVSWPIRRRQGYRGDRVRKCGDGRRDDEGGDGDPMHRLTIGTAIRLATTIGSAAV